MKQDEKDIYELEVMNAILDSELELVSINAEEDYIETLCPICKHIDVFHKNELDLLQCSRCNEEKKQDLLEWEIEDIVSEAGFELGTIDYDEDYIEVVCPICERTTSYRLAELKSISCRFCEIEKLANVNDFDVFWDFDFDDLLDFDLGNANLESQYAEWRRTNDDEPVLLVCRICGQTHLINPYRSNAKEQISRLNCPCRSLAREMKRVASDYGFSLEFRDCPTGEYSLNKGEVACICNKCGESIVLNYNDVSKISNLKCKNVECSWEDELIPLTQSGRIGWCRDLLGVVSIADFTKFNQITFENGEHMQIPDDDNHEVFFTIDPDDLSYAYAFIVFPNATNEWLSKYLLFRFEISTWGTSRICVEMNARWPWYYRELYRVIAEDINSGEQRVLQTLRTTFDSYINAYNSLHDLNPLIWDMSKLASTFRRISSKMERLLDEDSNNKAPLDRSFQKYLQLHSCPVCQSAYTSTAKVCFNCGFTDLNRVFINKDDADYWKKHVLRPYKNQYEKKE